MNIIDPENRPPSVGVEMYTTLNQKIAGSFRAAAIILETNDDSVPEYARACFPIVFSVIKGPYEAMEEIIRDAGPKSRHIAGIQDTVP